MKLLVQVNTVAGLLESEVQYAIIEVTSEMQEYLTKRRALFTASQQYADDLWDMRFSGCAFVTFYDNIDLDAVMDESEQHLLEQHGYWKVSDDFANDEEASECECTQVVLDGDTWYITTYETSTLVEVKTREIPYGAIQ
jgi:hypothetical protein